MKRGLEDYVKGMAVWDNILHDFSAIYSILFKVDSVPKSLKMMNDPLMDQSKAPSDSSPERSNELVALSEVPLLCKTEDHSPSPSSSLKEPAPQIEVITHSESPDIIIDDMQTIENKVEKMTINTSIDSIRNKLLNRAKPKKGFGHLNFRAKINPNENKSAEEELRKTISKSDFQEVYLSTMNVSFM